MDIESLGGGAGTGIIGAILVAFGFSRRVSKIEEGKQGKSVCDALHKGIDEKFTILVDGQKAIWERLDSLNDFLRNQR